MFLLDYNEERSLHTSPYDDTSVKYSEESLNFDIDADIHEESAKIHINTLSPFVGFGGGSYLMTDVKRMSAKEDFLKMSLKDRNCEVESFEECKTRKLMEQCNCVPWELPGFQVRFHSSPQYIFSGNGHV